MHQCQGSSTNSEIETAFKLPTSTPTLRNASNKSFMDQTQWEVTGGSHPASSTWIETGLLRGYASAMGHSQYNVYTQYWADQRAGATNYHSHIASYSLPLHSSYDYQFFITPLNASATSWEVQDKAYKGSTFEGSEHADSTGDPSGGAYQAMFGLESTCGKTGQDWPINKQDMLRKLYNSTNRSYYYTSYGSHHGSTNRGSTMSFTWVTGGFKFSAGQHT